MNCLEADQLARVALGFDVDNDAQAHLDACPACRERLAELRALGDRLARAHGRFDKDHDRQRAALLAALETEDRATEPKRSRPAIATWLGGLSMRQKTALGGLSVTALILIVFALSTNTARRATAMERMAENIRAAKSWQATMELEKVDERERPRRMGKQSAKVYWQAPGSFRWDAEALEHDYHGTEIHHRDKPGIDIDHVRKKFRRTKPRRGPICHGRSTECGPPALPPSRPLALPCRPPGFGLLTCDSFGSALRWQPSIRSSIR